MTALAASMPRVIRSLQSAPPSMEVRSSHAVLSLSDRSATRRSANAIPPSRRVYEIKASRRPASGGYSSWSAIEGFAGVELAGVELDSTDSPNAVTTEAPRRMATASHGRTTLSRSSALHSVNSYRQ